MNKIYLSPVAESDLAEIKKYIAEDLENPSAALSTIKKITENIRMLSDYSLIGTPLFSVADVRGGYRYLVVDNYMVFYRAKGEKVYIDRILYGSAIIFAFYLTSAKYDPIKTQRRT